MSGENRDLREPLIAFCVVTAVAAGMYWTGRAVPVVQQNLHVIVAVAFYLTPMVAARVARRDFDYWEAGLRLSPVGRGAATLGVVAAVTLPLFALAFFLYYGAVCGPARAHVPAALAAMCGRWRGIAGGHLRLPGDFATFAASQVFAVALPEELFFRGYLLGRLEAWRPPRRRLLGAPVGTALVAASALFALGHVLVDFNPQRLAVFFPALAFGWMRARTGSIVPGALFHALCNVTSDVLHTSYFA